MRILIMHFQNGKVAEVELRQDAIFNNVCAHLFMSGLVRQVDVHENGRIMKTVYAELYAGLMVEEYWRKRS